MLSVNAIAHHRARFAHDLRRRGMEFREIARVLRLKPDEARRYVAKFGTWQRAEGLRSMPGTVKALVATLNVGQALTVANLNQRSTIYAVARRLGYTLRATGRRMERVR